ncbi:DNA repair protein SWI5-like [Oopsacas minuta]|uniref:DNA repair protein SWI5 homolog n=1 Tax=Oopsacas minuta TaxID=111878 RepID=A0AAV7JBD6_9METZ|nr:DNA repair protein SWI5-like [Oopsacas minuta]
MATNSPPKKRHKQESIRDPNTNTESKVDLPINLDKEQVGKQLNGSSIGIQPEKFKTAPEKYRLETEISILNDESIRLKKRLESLSSEYSEFEMQDILDKLHEYNDIKDVTQILLGKLADFDEIPVSALYPRFGLKTTD